MVKSIFILGIEHSGTTILYRILARNKEFAWFSQYSILNNEIPGLKKYFINNFPVNRYLSCFQTHWTKDVGERHFLPVPIEFGELWDYYLPQDKLFYTQEDAIKYPLNELKGRIEDELRRWKKNTILIKRPMLTRYIGLLNEVFSDPYFIVLIRDGKAVSLSNLIKFSKTPLRKTNALEQSIKYWADTANYIDSISKKLDNLMIIRYEDFCNDVHGHINKILYFCNIQLRINLSKVPTQLYPTNEKWFNKPTIQQKKLINKVAKNELKKFGYQTFNISYGNK